MQKTRGQSDIRGKRSIFLKSWLFEKKVILKGSMPSADKSGEKKSFFSPARVQKFSVNIFCWKFISRVNFSRSLQKSHQNGLLVTTKQVIQGFPSGPWLQPGKFQDYVQISPKSLCKTIRFTHKNCVLLIAMY